MDDKRLSTLWVAMTAFATGGLVALMMMLSRRRERGSELLEKAADTETAKDVMPEAQRALERLQELLSSNLGGDNMPRRLRDAQGRVIEFSKAVTPEVVSRVKKARAQAGQVDAGRIVSALRYLPQRMPIDLESVGSRAREGLGQAGGVARQGLSTTQAALDRGVGTALAMTPRIEEIIDEAWHGGMQGLKERTSALTRRGSEAAQMPARAGEAIGQRVDRAEQEARDFGAMLFWLGVAGGVIYLLMSPEQREKLMKSLTQALGRALPDGSRSPTSGDTGVYH